MKYLKEILKEFYSQRKRKIAPGDASSSPSPGPTPETPQKVSFPSTFAVSAPPHAPRTLPYTKKSSVPISFNFSPPFSPHTALSFRIEKAKRGRGTPQRSTSALFFFVFLAARLRALSTHFFFLGGGEIKKKQKMKLLPVKVRPV